MASHQLSAAELLDAVSICRDRPAAEAGVHLATLAARGLSFDACAHLAIGARDAALAGLYEAMFGRQLELAATCPGCGTRLDVSLTTAALLFEPGEAVAPTIKIGRRRFGVRPVDSEDLAAAAEIAELEAARELLARRCLVPADGKSVPGALSSGQVDAVAAALAAVDPGSDLYVPLTCFRCEAAWDAPIDIARVLAAELSTAADTLLGDIHDLALAYHWSEDAILALAPSRRQAYLQRLRG
ncbi:MAG TPA: hypothetical protein VNU97_07565 [Rhizomicrobium sp.]|jgi:hypothetical protein|nr:hypothetical protein [Rhizomicrobium sp.]